MNESTDVSHDDPHTESTKKTLQDRKALKVTNLSYSAATHEPLLTAKPKIMSNVK